MIFPRAHRQDSRGPLRLHIGCGQEALDGWINIDSRELPRVDRVLDVRKGLPFQDVAAIYAEHFLEHLVLEDGLAFLRECRRALGEEGVLRLSTPNLDWVIDTHYHFAPDASSESRIYDCFQLNRAFHGWGHQFLYNQPMLEASLRDAGFGAVRFERYGESEIPFLRGLERHETWTDTAELPHVLIAEASGRSSAEVLPEEIRSGFEELPLSPWNRLKIAALRRVRRLR
jgi:predicted SAM-dependent methyltransferase